MSFLKKSTIWQLVLLLLLAGSYLLNLFEFTQSFFILAAVSFICELIDSSLGMGYGTILTSTLLLSGYEPMEIVPTLLLSELFTGFACAYFHDQIENVDLSLRGVQMKRALLLGISSIIGLTIGVHVAETLASHFVIFLIGCIVILSGLFVVLLANVQIEYKNWKMFCVAIVAAFNKSISGGGYGPLVTSGQILSGIQGKSAVGITAFAEGFTCLLSVLLFTYVGEPIKSPLLFPLIFGALTSVTFSAFLVSRFREKNFKLLVGCITMLLGSLLILKVLL